ncbi:DgyrCDS8497 [Dimorphilus gyrociliatus]|uniref:Large ribosomal subunit protein uL23m n=1 Tax=Dimorphilus gyrociliatus TaxID=2664684 RepID=A0A7I8VVU5_9ANNE|nr:DgyrCDS8497 [Dimorphilus gyrociliatus]
MSSQFLQKLSVYIPLWKQKIPKYPLWYKNNPQLRIYLPLFWMKMIRAEKYNKPKDYVAFEVHPQMTNHDVKQYLEKVYRIPVRRVRTTLLRPEEKEGFARVLDHKNKLIRRNISDRDDQIRMAFVQLADGYEYTFPNLFKSETPEDKDLKEASKIKDSYFKDKRVSWDMSDLPSWFR